MIEILIAILVAFGLLFIAVIAIYNSLVKLKNNVKKSFAGIDVQLKRRNDLIPNLVNIVQGYASHEKALFENLTKARSSIINSASNGDINAIAEGENMLSGALKSVFAVVENYPDLKANQNFLELQDSLEETEDQIAAARRIYNENVNYLNTSIEVFPSNLIAKMFGFKQADLFEINKSDRKEISI